MRLRIGYPDVGEEKKILERPQAFHPAEELMPVVSAQDVMELQRVVEEIRMEESLLDYLLAIVTATRQSEWLTLGVSTRGAMALCKAAKGLAMVRGREYCVPDDIKELAPIVLSHRVMASGNHGGQGFEEAERVIHDILENVPVPV
jgi:MoxR-like ATPase